MRGRAEGRNSTYELGGTEDTIHVSKRGNKSIVYVSEVDVLQKQGCCNSQNFKYW